VHTGRDVPPSTAHVLSTYDLCHPPLRGATQPYLGFTFLFVNQLSRMHLFQPGIVSSKAEPIPSALATKEATSRPCFGLDEGLRREPEPHTSTVPVMP
jgi:hypothetical protein